MNVRLAFAVEVLSANPKPLQIFFPHQNKNGTRFSPQCENTVDTVIVYHTVGTYPCALQQFIVFHCYKYDTPITAMDVIDKTKVLVLYMNECRKKSL